ncbi:TadE/TadG family type IV pilus assembly protein [Massilia jejuensis]|uniref:TadE/TadG family type IV pilus assembly protein n=1 Tax=Massilia jejuensis TaxID=648894 RepID=A0ABW0PE54_9BURK
MRRARKITGQQYGRGSIAVEAAIVLPILVLFFGLPSILLAFYFRQYTAVQKATHDAAIYLATAPRLEMTTTGPDGNFAALTVAKKIVEKELAGIVPDGVSVTPYVSCMYRVGNTTQMNACTSQIFKVETNTLFRLDVAINVPYINPLTGREVDAWYMSVVAPVRYLGK